MMSEWKVQYNPPFGYIAARIRNVNEVVHTGNLEFFGEYTKDKEECQKRVDELNNGILKET